MATQSSATRATPAESGDRPATIETRIDAAHSFGDRPHTTPPVDASSPPTKADASNATADDADLFEGASAAADFVQLRIHARQIATQLKARKEDVDRREAAVAQQLADLEKTARQARLHLDDQQQTIAEREAQLIRREQIYIERIEQLVKLDDPETAATLSPIEIGQLDDPRLIALAELFRRWHEERQAMTTAHDELQRRRETLDLERAKLEQEIIQQRESAMRSVHAALEQVEKRRESLDQRERVLEQDNARQRQAIAEREETLLRQITAREEALEEAKFEWSKRKAEPTPSQRELADSLTLREEMIADREQVLKQAEEQLQEGLAEVDRQRAAVRAERERLEGQARLDRQRLADEQRRREAELLEKRKLVEQMAGEVNARRAAVENEHDDVLQLHRETLELRLATEELWNQLITVQPSAKLTQALGQGRQRLAEQYRLEASELDRRKVVLDDLRAKIAGQIEELTERHEQMTVWFADRRTELEQHAAALVAREQEQDALSAEHRQAQQLWQRQRMELEQETRRLRHELSVARLQS
jgi:hypothetical protein